MRKIFLVLISVSVMTLADMSRNSAGIVTDSMTDLEWQDNYGDNDNKIKRTKWEGAIEYCNALTLDNGGWRLPNINELRSIVVQNKYKPSIDDGVNAFQNTTTYDDGYWSSTTGVYSTNSTAAWIVDFSHGNSFGMDKFIKEYVRCVRDKQ